MSKFSADRLEGLDYDFTGIPANDGGMCTGKGYVPEPTKAREQAFRALAVKVGKIAELPPEKQAAAYAKDPELGDEAMLTALADFCGGHPSKEELAQLPPRALLAFSQWISTEVFNPKDSTTSPRR
jgi:hypothetical protein